MSDDRFFDRLREDARPLRHEPDEIALARIRARIQAHIVEQASRPSVAQLLAGWFRPLAATLTAVAIAAGIGIAVTNASTEPAVTYDSVEISMAGDTYLVGN